MDREVIVVYTTEENDENLYPNAQQRAVDPTPASLDEACTARSVTEGSPALTTTTRGESGTSVQAVPGTTVNPRLETRTPASTTTASRATPNVDRASVRPLKQLLLSGPPQTTSEKKRRCDLQNDREARSTTTVLRPLYRNRRTTPSHNIPAPPPLRPARMTERIEMTHIVVHEGEYLEPAVAPPTVPTLGLQYNPDDIKFQDVQVTKMCSCKYPCRVNSCTNVAEHIFCNPWCCPFEGTCGNGLNPSRWLALMQHSVSKDFTIVAAHPIDAHVVVGEYLGQMKFETFKFDERPKNRGFRLYMHHEPDHPAGARVCIDAEIYGSILRYVNHSCFANARFRQVCNDTNHTVVVVTNRRLQRGEELFVDYGAELWFHCRCGGNSQHRGFTRRMSGSAGTGADAEYISDADDEMEAGSDVECKADRQIDPEFAHHLGIQVDPDFVRQMDLQCLQDLGRLKAEERKLSKLPAIDQHEAAAAPSESDSDFEKD